MERQVTEVNICPAIMTDHRTILLKLNLKSQGKRVFNHWKCNSSLLCNKEFTGVLKNLIEQYWKYAVSNDDYGTYWELLKYEIRKFAIQFSKELAKKKRVKIENLIKCISDITLNMLGDDGDVSPQLDNLQRNWMNFIEREG